MAFDPGGTTGFAMLNRKSDVVYTAALTLDALRGFVYILRKDTDVVIEDGPSWGHHSPVTKRAEEVCKEAFPNAHLVPPSRWKSPPAKKRDYRYVTRHEQDAVGLARWFQAQERNIDENTHTARQDSSSTRHLSN